MYLIFKAKWEIVKKPSRFSFTTVFVSHMDYITPQDLI